MSKTSEAQITCFKQSVVEPLKHRL